MTLHCIVSDCQREAMYIFRGNSLCGVHRFELTGEMPT